MLLQQEPTWQSLQVSAEHISILSATSGLYSNIEPLPLLNSGPAFFSKETLIHCLHLNLRGKKTPPPPCVMPQQALGVIWRNPLSNCLRPAQHSLTFRITQHVVNFDLLTLSNTGEPCSKPPGVASPNWANQHGPLTFSHMVSVSKVPSRSLEGAAEI